MADTLEEKRLAVNWLETAFSAHESKYREVESRWRNKQADIMELLCADEQREITAAERNLVRVFGLGIEPKGVSRRLAAAKRMIDEVTSVLA